MSSRKWKLPKRKLIEAKTYAVNSMFLSIQGEGVYTGRRAVFIRFRGCNVWSGREEDRERDAQRHSPCARICDTGFRSIQSHNGGGRFTATELVARCQDLWDFPGGFFVVLTGGEPGLQVDKELIGALKDAGGFIAIETNGTCPLPDGIDHVTVSPKPPMKLHPAMKGRFDEVKLLYPLFENYINAAEKLCKNRYLQPVHEYDVGCSYLEIDNAIIRGECVRYVLEHTGWGLSIQSHKILYLE